MPAFTPTSLVVSLLFWAACLWIFLFIYNVPLCALHRGWLKSTTKRLNQLLFFVAPPLALFFFHDSPWLNPILRLERLHAAHVVVGAVLAVGFVGQFLVTWRLLFRRAPEGVLAQSVRRAPMAVSLDQWNSYLDRQWTRQPRGGERPLGPRSKPVPKYRRKVSKVRPHRLRIRFLLKPPLDWVNQSYDLRVHELTLSFSNLPKSFDGLRVLQLSDNHYGEIMSPAWHEHVCREAMALRPDLIALTGDLVAGDHLYRQAVESMKSLRAPLGVYVVRGNHDFYTEPHIIAYWLESQGFNLMSNRHTDLERDGQILRICGVEHPYVPIKSFQGALGPEPRNDRPFRLVLAHSPDVATRLERLGADLFLTGHTHGGQWRLPVIGPVIYPSIHGRRFDKGIQKLGDALLHNSSGFGLHTIPLRLNCPPEITLFTLRRGNEKDTESLAYNIQT